MCDRYSRSELLLGKGSTEKLKNSSVAVVGIGGVGSYCVEALARSGIGKICLVDNDVYNESNMNRQLYAINESLGKFKTDTAEQRINQINPECSIINKKVFLNSDSISDLKLESYDYVVDAIDSINSKVGLIVYCKEHNIPVISSMGAGNKLDPTAFKVADLYETSVCPLARIMRKKLKPLGVESLKVVYSKETPVDINQNITASVPFVPSVCGLIIAGEVIKDLINNI